ncbi:hypothetical protein PSPTOT1_5178 [Pseudomonas syringae pv. tomato T1]|nr:hypothetical protein PSPTOT1_5178 [Pseudomonas syringae pv. tomato T1]
MIFQSSSVLPGAPPFAGLPCFSAGAGLASGSGGGAAASFSRIGIWSMVAKISLGSIAPDFSIFFSPSLPTRITLVCAPAPSFSSRIKAMVDCASRVLPLRSPIVLTTVNKTMLRCAKASRLAGSSSAFLRLTSVGSIVLGAMMIRGRDLPRSCARGLSLSAANAVPAATSRLARVRDRINMVGSFQIHWVAIARRQTRCWSVLPHMGHPGTARCSPFP